MLKHVPACHFYYKTRYKKDILKLLGFFMEYDPVSIHIALACKVMELDYGWSILKFGKIFQICYGLGFLDDEKTKAKQGNTTTSKC